MNNPRKVLLALGAVASFVLMASMGGLQAADKDLLPSQLTKEQQDNLLRFLQQHEKPDRFIPPDAKLVGTDPDKVDLKPDTAPGKPIKQYTVQITSHRPVPGQEEVKRVDVYYYRPNPEKGKPGITVRHTVDVTTGKQVGQTEILLNHATALSHEELGEAVEMAKEKSPAVQGLYKDRDKSTVHWEYLQLLLNRKHEQHEPGDRVVRLLFTVTVPEGQTAPTPVPVIVNLTKGLVLPEKSDKQNKNQGQGKK